MNSKESAKNIIDEFSFFDNWNDRYQHIIDQGRKLSPMKSEWYAEKYLIKGCQSLVYFNYETDTDGNIHYHGTSDSAIVQGLIAILLRVYSGRLPEEILATSDNFLKEIGLGNHLSFSRKNGLASIIKEIQKIADNQKDNTR